MAGGGVCASGGMGRWCEDAKTRLLLIGDPSCGGSFSPAAHPPPNPCRVNDHYGEVTMRTNVEPLQPTPRPATRKVDDHYGELTVRETFEFSARCQSVGYKRGG